MNKIVAQNIRTIREMKNLTRDYVACEINMSNSGYSKIERGEIDLTISKLSKIAAVFEILATDILNFDVAFFFNSIRQNSSDNFGNFVKKVDSKVLPINSSNLKENIFGQRRKI